MSIDVSSDAIPSEFIMHITHARVHLRQNNESKGLCQYMVANLKFVAGCSKRIQPMVLCGSRTKMGFNVCQTKKGNPVFLCLGIIKSTLMKKMI